MNSIINLFKYVDLLFQLRAVKLRSFETNNRHVIYSLEMYKNSENAEILLLGYEESSLSRKSLSFSLIVYSIYNVAFLSSIVYFQVLFHLFLFIYVALNRRSIGY